MATNEATPTRRGRKPAAEAPAPEMTKGEAFKAKMAAAKAAKAKATATEAIAPAKRGRKPAAPAAEAAPAPARAPREEQNGILLPRENSIAHALWSKFNEFSGNKQRPILVDEAHELLDEEFEPGTIGAQYTNWCRFYGITKEMRAQVRASLRGDSKRVEPAPAPVAPTKRGRKPKAVEATA